MSKASSITIGMMVSILIRVSGHEPADIQGEVVGIRADYMNPDLVAVKLAGLDAWIVMDDNVEIGVI